MRKITDMGISYGRQAFHVSGDPTRRDVIVTFSREEGIIYKCPKNGTTVEMAARLTAEECAVIVDAWNRVRKEG